MIIFNCIFKRFCVVIHQVKVFHLIINLEIWILSL